MRFKLGDRLYPVQSLNGRWFVQRPFDFMIPNAKNGTADGCPL